MGTIRFFRHSLKRGEFISAEGFELIASRKEYVPKVGKIFVSPYVRTIETAASMLMATGQKKVKIIQLESLGAPEVEAMMFSNETFIEDYMSNPAQNQYELMERHFSPQELTNMEAICAKAMKEMVPYLEEDEMAIAVGHTPYIAMGRNYFFPKEKIKDNMSEMDYLDIKTPFLK